MKTAVQMEPASGSAIEYQEASPDIWDKKYRLKSKHGQIIDETMDDTYIGHINPHPSHTALLQYKMLTCIA